MKRIFGLGLLVVALFAAAAFGAEFGRLSIDVANGWNASQDGSTVAITRSDNTAAMTVTLESQGGASLEALAAEWSKQLGGNQPEQITEGDFAGDYMFAFTNAQGVNGECLLSGDGTDYIVVMVIGTDNNPDAEAEAMAMFKSIALK